ncbi:MAG: tRNA (adenosine(37)-N6)-threonylcarbamoyltransferase complex ATPase subunit type 1 TsaE, partial [Clostridia bacterium]|nr:tRNA (adenosine(37)-N6)-threonylcarbamoyltransferase complex ATPase subunit type 1 TsaE [Clostridia bacterium]
MMEFLTNNDTETALIAGHLAKILTPGDVVLLHGEMGVGKTVFTKGLCAALGVKDMVSSPTFTVVNEYDGEEMPVFHFDLYRIEEADELLEIGFEEYIRRGGVCVIEWPQNAGRYLPKRCFAVTILRTTFENQRQIIIENA